MRRFLRDLVVPVTIAIALAFLVQATLAKPYQIPTESMEPTIMGASANSSGDRILANRLVYRFRDVERGDIVVFDATPEARRACPSQDPDVPFVKRVIAVGGDTIEVTPEGPIVNGEPFVVEDARPGSATLDEQVVPEGELFLLGDNRPDSCDSVMWDRREGNAFIPTENVIGQAESTYWPLNRIGLLS